MGSTDGKAQRSPSSKLNIKVVYFCQVDGCKSKLSNCKPYCVRYRVCPAHLAAPQVQLQCEASRFCQQCGKFHAIEEFDGNKRSCRTRLMHHNNSRQQRRREAALQQSVTTTLMLQHTGVRAAPGRRNSQPTAAAAAEPSAAAATATAGSEPSNARADDGKQSANCSNIAGNSSESAARQKSGQQQQQQHGNDSSSNTSLDSTQAASQHQEQTAADTCTLRDTCSPSQQQQQQGNASGDATCLWDFFANQGPYTAAAAAHGGSTGGNSSPQDSLAGSAADLHSQQQQQHSPVSAAAPTSRPSLTACDHNGTTPHFSMMPAADTAWTSSNMQQLRRQQAQLGCSASAANSPAVEDLQQRPAVAARPYSDSSSPANLPASAFMAAAGSAMQGNTAADTAAMASAPNASAVQMLTAFDNTAGYEPVPRPRYAMPSPAAALAAAAAAAAASPGYAAAADAGAAGSGSAGRRCDSFTSSGSYATGSLPCAQLLTAGAGGADITNTISNSMERVFRSSMSSGGSFSCMPLGAAAAHSSPVFKPGLPSPCSFTTSSTAAGAAYTPGTATAGYNPAAAAGAGGAGSGGAFAPSVLAAAGLDLSNMCTVPGCTSCPPHTRVGGSLSAWQGLTPSAAAGATGYSMAYRGSSAFNGGPHAAAAGGAGAQGYAMQPAASAAAAAVPSSMLMDWQPGVSNAMATTTARDKWGSGWSDAARLYDQAEQQAQQQKQYQAWSQHQNAAAPVQQQYSQQSDQSRQYSLAVDAAIAAAALAAAGSMEPPTAQYNSTGLQQELMFGVAANNPANNGTHFNAQPAALSAGRANAADAAGAAAHCDVWSSLHTSQQKQQPSTQQKLMSCSSYDGATANTVAAYAASAGSMGGNAASFYNAAAAGGLQRRWASSLAPSCNLPSAVVDCNTPAAAAAAAGAQGVLYGFPERQAASGMQGAACFATAGSSSSIAFHSIPGIPISAGMDPPTVLSGVPLTTSADCELANITGLSAEALQSRLLAQMSAAAAAATAHQQQQQVQRKVTAGTPEGTAFSVASEQQQVQMQPSTPHTANPVVLNNSPTNGLPTSAAYTAAAAGLATASMWQAAAGTADATPFAAAAAAAGQLTDAPAAVGSGRVRGDGDSFGGFCDALLGSANGLHELLHSWNAEGGEEQLESMVLQPDDVDML